ncbi:glycosyltransferase [Cryomorphaceae bacterium 1068]|nr:glycosyltransferase [Cryomorphaceae bacterium 1068]
MKDHKQSQNDFSKVRVVHISTVHSSSDHRLLDKECKTLAEAGFDTFLIARADKDYTKFGVQVLAFPTYKSRISRATIGVWKITLRAISLKPKIAHIHDPELLWSSWIFRLFGIKFIYDSHEHVPNQITSKPWIKPTWFRRLIAFFASGYEHFFCLFANKVISVVPEIVERFPENKRLMIRNFPPFDSSQPPIDHIKTKKIVAIYAGGLTRIRGIAEIIQAFAELGSGFELRLLGPWDTEDFRADCMSNAGENVKYLGLVSPAEVSKQIRQADIGLAILYPVKNYLMSYPVKAFEYMKEGVPIVMSSFPYWKELYSSCAEFVDPHDISQIKEAIETLGKSPEKRTEFGLSGYRLVKEVYNWESEGENLKEAYLSLLK